MNILTRFLITLPLICTPLAAAAEKGGSGDPNERAWERANDNASFKRGDGGDKHESRESWRKPAGDRNGDYRDRDYRDSESQYRGSRDPNRVRDRDDDRRREYSGDERDDNPVGRMIRGNHER